MKRTILVSILIALCFYVYGCGDEGIELTLQEIGAAPSAPFPAPLGTSQIGPVPKEIQDLVWGKDIPTLMAELEESFEKGQTVSAQYIIRDICLRREQEAYYGKYINAGGVAIMGHKSVDDDFFYAARDIVLGMTQKRPELRAWLTPTREDRPGARGGVHAVTNLAVPARDFRYILFPPFLGLSSMPERHLSPHSLIPNWSVSGAIGFCSPHNCWQAVQKINWNSGDGEPKLELSIADVFCHEFGHVIHYAIRLIDPTFEDRLQSAYEEAINNAPSVNNPDGKGYWPSGSYALSNKGEFWAECAKVWFTDLSAPDLSKWYDRFREGLPLMHALMQEWFDLVYLREVEWREY